MNGGRLAAALFGLSLLLIAAGCRPAQRGVPAQAARDAGAAPPAGGVPAAFGALRLAPERGASGEARYRVTSGRDASVSFLVPSNLVAGILGNERVPAELREQTLLAYAAIATNAAPGAGPEAAGAAFDAARWPAPVRLQSASRGAVEAWLDPGDARYALVRAAGGTWRLPAGAAFDVLHDARLGDGQKAEALLTYPLAERAAAMPAP